MKLTLRVIAILGFIIAIAWMIYSPGFEPLLAFFAGITTLILSFVGGEKETETLDQRNRRILLNHVENFWVKGVLEKSLHGAAMLELGIKEDPAAVTYPWAIKQEATDETLPTGMPMLEIFEKISMGRSLLILGAPGSGKTTMMLELARQLIERARQNADEPIPMVFNLASWTEKLSLADWLAQELNNIYYVPRKTAPNWVKGNKLLLLLDGLDEVRQESRAKCVDAINQFRKEHGLTSLAVCSRSQDYADLNAKLSFEGAIEVQPLTQKQVNEFFNRFGKEMAGLKLALKKDSALREMAKTPLFLSIMVMSYRDKQENDIFVSKDMEAQRKNLFDYYIETMFKRPHAINNVFKKLAVVNWLSWLADRMTIHHQIPFFVDNIQPIWLDQKRHIKHYRWTIAMFGGLAFMLIGALSGGFNGGLFGILGFGLIFGLCGGLLLLSGTYTDESYKIRTIEKLTWNSKTATVGLLLSLLGGLIVGLQSGKLGFWLAFGLIGGLLFGLFIGLEPIQVKRIFPSGERLSLSARNFLFAFPISGLVLGIVMGFVLGPVLGQYFGLFSGLYLAMFLGGFALIHHYALRFIFARNNLLPWKLIPFLDYCTDLIFLRRVGGGHIFIHRLLMEHFAAMYKEESDQRIGSG